MLIDGRGGGSGEDIIHSFGHAESLWYSVAKRSVVEVVGAWCNKGDFPETTVFQRYPLKESENIIGIGLPRPDLFAQCTVEAKKSQLSVCI